MMRRPPFFDALSGLLLLVILLVIPDGFRLLIFCLLNSNSFVIILTSRLLSNYLLSFCNSVFLIS